jgi:hypothetical protein
MDRGKEIFYKMNRIPRDGQDESRDWLRLIKQWIIANTGWDQQACTSQNPRRADGIA